MPRTEYSDPEAEKAYQDMADNSSKPSGVPLPKERPSSADAEWNNSQEGRLDAESRALKNPDRSWLGKALLGSGSPK